MRLDRKVWGGCLALQLGVLASLWSGLSSASSEHACPSGVWQGLAGGVPITLELSGDSALNRPSGKYHFLVRMPSEIAGRLGRYYYRDNLADIPLARSAKDPVRWKQIDPDKGDVTGVFTLVCDDEGIMSGSLESAVVRGATEIPLRATPAKSYFARRMGTLGVEVVDASSMAGHAYEVLGNETYPDINGLKLDGTRKEIAAINEELLEEYSSQLAAAHTCSARKEPSERPPEWLGAGGFSAPPGPAPAVWSDNSVLEWNDYWVVVESRQKINCEGGELRDYRGQGVSTYDFKKGKREDTSLWIIEPYRTKIPVQSVLWKTLMLEYRSSVKRSGRHVDIEQCVKDVSFGVSADSVWPDSGGVMFRPSVAGADESCEQEVLLSFEDARLYLTERGAWAVSAFMPTGFARSDGNREKGFGSVPQVKKE